MSPRTSSLLAVLALTLSAGCGEESSPGEGRFGIDLLVDKAVAADLGSFQIAVLPDGARRNCTELQTRCLSQQVNASELLILRDGQGTQGRVLRFPVNLSGTGGTSQDVTIEVPVGRDYVLVIEGISKENPPRLLGSSCNRMPDGVSAGQNNPILATPMTLVAVDCNPTIGG